MQLPKSINQILVEAYIGSNEGLNYNLNVVPCLAEIRIVD
jgi:hypothetical protein